VGALDDLSETETIPFRIETKIRPDKDAVAKVFVTGRAEKSFTDDDVGIEAIGAEEMAAFRHSRSNGWVESDRADKVIWLVRDDGKEELKRRPGARTTAKRIESVVECALEVRSVRKFRELPTILVHQLHITGDIRRCRRWARSPENPTLLPLERNPARRKLVSATWRWTPTTSGAFPLRQTSGLPQWGMTIGDRPADRVHNSNDRRASRGVEKHDGTSIKRNAMNQRTNLAMRIFGGPGMSAGRSHPHFFTARSNFFRVNRILAVTTHGFDCPRHSADSTLTQGVYLSFNPTALQRQSIVDCSSDAHFRLTDLRLDLPMKRL
jgi:hypothetical protein